jgi:hypothetical protein
LVILCASVYIFIKIWSFYVLMLTYSMKFGQLNIQNPA